MHLIQSASPVEQSWGAALQHFVDSIPLAWARFR